MSLLLRTLLQKSSPADSGSSSDSLDAFSPRVWQSARKVAKEMRHTTAGAKVITNNDTTIVMFVMGYVLEKRVWLAV